MSNTTNTSIPLPSPLTMVDDTTKRLEFEKYIGMMLALTSSILIGTSFIVTKKGLIDVSRNGGRAGEGFDYLYNPMWWAGTVTMILGEVANFLAYSFAPAILVTPLGAGSVFVGAILSSIFLNEVLGRDGIIGCVLCVLGSLMVILHSPEEQDIRTVDEVFFRTTRPAFVVYMLLVISVSLYLIYVAGPKHGKKNMLIYISICSLVGSISVMAVKGFSVAVRLTFAGQNQLGRPTTWVFGLTVLVCAMTQINYFNKALDLFSTSRVTPIYYVFFTTATILASIILFEGIHQASGVQVATVLVGFITIFIGVFMINSQDRPSMRRSSSTISNPPGSISIKLTTRGRGGGTFLSEQHLLRTFDEDIGSGISSDDLLEGPAQRVSSGTTGVLS